MRENVPILPVLRLKTPGLFRAKLVPVDGECLTYTGTRNKAGYGFVQVMIKGRRYPILAHRLAWVLEHGREIPADKIICHRCNNPSCCNPKHLYLGTHQDNSDDMEKAGTVPRGTRGGLYGVRGVAHPRSKYDQATKDKVVELRAWARSYREITELTGINAQTAARWWGEHVDKVAKGACKPS
jgi:hypothetical protein